MKKRDSFFLEIVEVIDPRGLRFRAATQSSMAKYFWGKEPKMSVSKSSRIPILYSPSPVSPGSRGVEQRHAFHSLLPFILELTFLFLHKKRGGPTGLNETACVNFEHFTSSCTTLCGLCGHTFRWLHKILLSVTKSNRFGTVLKCQNWTT